MSSRVIIEIVIIFLLILANGFFAASEIAVVSVRKGRLQQQAVEGNTNAQKALELATHPDRFLATVQIGITFIATFTAAFGGASISDDLAQWFSQFPALSEYAEVLALGIVVLVITYFSLILGELAPKRLALQSAERVATFTAPVMTVLSIVARPVIAFINASVNLVLRLVGLRNSSDSAVTEEDIVQLTHEGIVSGTVEAGEGVFVQRVFRFTDLQGLVTLEDLVEELVGEIQSEYQARDEQVFAQRGDGSWLVDGMVAYDTVWERIGIPAPSSEKPLNDTTLAEFIQLYLGHNPSIGDLVTIGNATLEIVDIDGKRIDRVLISRQK